MVSEGDFHVARAGLNPAPCAFEKAVLARCVDCPAAERHLLAERETVGCGDPTAQSACVAVRQAMLTHFAFVLKLSHPDGPVPHAKLLKAQCGGLQGLSAELAGSGEVPDVCQLVGAALARYGSVDALPYAEVMSHVVRFTSRH